MNNCLIILNYNDSERVQKLVEKVSGYQLLQHILVVDNCSTDHSYEKLTLLKNDKVDVIRNHRNSGYAAGNNYGAEYAQDRWGPDILFFANPDVFFEDRTVEAIEAALCQDTSYAVAAALVKDGYNVWDLPGYWGTLRMLFLVSFSLHKARIKRKLKRGGGIQEAGVVEGSFFAVKASIFWEIQGFDERTFLYLEENMLAQKLHRLGYKEVINVNAFYLHEHSKSVLKEYKSKARAFKLFWPSFQIYLKYYVNCGKLGKSVFGILYAAAYIERVLFDVAKKLRIV